jgi:AP-3 complex subunit beta
MYVKQPLMLFLRSTRKLPIKLPVNLTLTRLDHEQKDTLIDIIKVLLSDRSTLVLGSAVAAFSEVCPERYDLIHPNYKKLCHLLADVDEWGQIEILNMMIRYARNQFEDPNKDKKNTTKKPKAPKKKDLFWNNDEQSEEDNEEEESEEDEYGMTEIDSDLRLLLDSAYPLLKNRNSGVVLSVAALYYHVAPLHEAQKVSKSLVRISKSKKEIQYVVLTNIASMAASRPQVFESFVNEFFISPADPSFCRTLKLEIITYLVNEDNINKILKEFKVINVTLIFIICI